MISTIGPADAAVATVSGVAPAAGAAAGGAGDAAGADSSGSKIRPQRWPLKGTVNSNPPRIPPSIPVEVPSSVPLETLVTKSERVCGVYGIRAATPALQATCTDGSVIMLA